MQDLFSVEGKKAVVTGGTRGIGFMIAEGLLKAGVEVFISSRKADACDEACRTLSQFGRVHAFARDLSEESECRLLVEQIGERTDEIDILVNNAGTTWGAPLETYPQKGWDRVMDLNVMGVFNMTRFLRPMLDRAAREDDPSRVINISSIDATMVPLFPSFAYSASKAAVNQLTVHLAAELSPKILVNAIAPGPFHTDMMDTAISERGDEIRGMTRVGRTGSAVDITGAVVYLASRASTFVTGAVLPVDGGISTTGPAR